MPCRSRTRIKKRVLLRIGANPFRNIEAGFREQKRPIAMWSGRRGRVDLGRNCLERPQTAVAVQPHEYVSGKLQRRVLRRYPAWPKRKTGQAAPFQWPRALAVPEDDRAKSIELGPPAAAFVGLLKVLKKVLAVIETECVIPRLIGVSGFADQLLRMFD